MSFKGKMFCRALLPSSSQMAHCQALPFAHELMAALYMTTFLGTEKIKSRAL